MPSAADAEKSPRMGRASAPCRPADPPPVEDGLAELMRHQTDDQADNLNAALPAIYEELRDIAASYLRHERPNHTLQPTALVHESYLRLLGQHSVDWRNRLQFISIAARMMRRILANYATARKTDKRDAGAPLLELDAALEVVGGARLDVVRLEQALRELEAMDARQAQVVELRFYGGLTIEETAEVLGISAATVQRDWVIARQWLYREITAGA